MWVTSSLHVDQRSWDRHSAHRWSHWTSGWSGEHRTHSESGCFQSLGASLAVCYPCQGNRPFRGLWGPTAVKGMQDFKTGLSKKEMLESRWFLWYMRSLTRSDEWFSITEEQRVGKFLWTLLQGLHWGQWESMQNIFPCFFYHSAC